MRLVADELGGGGAALGPAHELALARHHLGLGAPAEADLPRGRAREVRQCVLAAGKGVGGWGQGGVRMGAQADIRPVAARERSASAYSLRETGVRKRVGAAGRGENGGTG